MEVAVLGGGSWGTTLAWLIGGKGIRVHLWCRDEAQAAQMAADRENRRYLPGLALPDSIAPTSELESAVARAEMVVVAVPVEAVRETLRHSAPCLRDDLPVAIAAKGLERETGLRLSEVAGEELGAGRLTRTAVISGPNLSGEIIRRLPTTTVAASRSEEVSRQIQEVLATPFFRVYTNADVIGVELGGALKNPIALAAGICDGLGFGNNSKASLLTRGLAEMTRLGVAAGARAETFSGLSGLGDLLATANSTLSRNYRVGLGLGRGETLQHARESLHQVAEGIPTTEAACRLAERLGVEVPLMAALRQILYEGKPAAEAVAALMSRPYRDEAIAD